MYARACVAVGVQGTHTRQIPLIALHARSPAPCPVLVGLLGLGWYFPTHPDTDIGSNASAILLFLATPSLLVNGNHECNPPLVVLYISS